MPPKKGNKGKTKNDGDDVDWESALSEFKVAPSYGSVAFASLPAVRGQS
jgi:hypothetical protein